MISLCHIGPHPAQHCGISRYYHFLSASLRQRPDVQLTQVYIEEAESTKDERHFTRRCTEIASNQYDIVHLQFADGTFRKDRSEGFIDFREEDAALLVRSGRVVATFFELGPRLVRANRLPIDPNAVTPELEQRIGQNLRRQIKSLLNVASGVIVHTEEQRHYLLNDPDFGGFVRSKGILVGVIRQGGMPLPPNYFHLRDRYRQAIRETYAIPPDAVVLIHHGFVRPNKNKFDFIPILQRRPNCVCLLAGGARQESHRIYLEEVLARAAQAGVRVVCTGWVEDHDVPKLYAASDIAILPYESGSDSNVLPTGLMFGLPSVTSDLNCFQTAKEFYGDCMAVCPSQQEFERIVIQIADNPTLRDAMSLSATRFREMDTWEAIACRTVSFYREVLRLCPRN